MTDPLDERLRADARTLVDEPVPSLDLALARATRRRPVGVPLAIAASVVAVGTVAVVAASLASGGDGSAPPAHPVPSGTSSAARLQLGTRVYAAVVDTQTGEPVAIAEARYLHLVLLTRWRCGTAEPAPLGVGVQEESSRVLVGPGMRQGGQASASVENQLDRPGGGPTFYGSPGAASPDPAPSPPASGPCVNSRADGVSITLSAPLGSRPVVADGSEVPVVSRSYGEPSYLPAGFRGQILDNLSLTPPLDTYGIWRRGGDVIRVDYGPADDIPSATGTPSGTVDVNGATATWYRPAPDRLVLRWRLPSGGAVRVAWSGTSADESELLRVARSVGDGSGS